ncbi:hypothetical protein PGT21_009205 [Puccinia graminis f. sp. tritici]|uniref:Uncharacterized protein n=1 Tax=Puccinia graminis f. sp. tritici TaxID=56615 RepID=A0A5B0LMJ3_PUCGR|nr:hypothetical protein PGT21_009205 [Puccinia graminis f. sp. tritici]
MNYYHYSLCILLSFLFANNCSGIIIEEEEKLTLPLLNKWPSFDENDLKSSEIISTSSDSTEQKTQETAIPPPLYFNHPLNLILKDLLNGGSGFKKEEELTSSTLRKELKEILEDILTEHTFQAYDAEKEIKSSVGKKLNQFLDSLLFVEKYRNECLLKEAIIRTYWANNLSEALDMFFKSSDKDLNVPQEVMLTDSWKGLKKFLDILVEDLKKDPRAS